MTLPKLTIEEYSKKLASNAPTPGGGASTGLAANQGACLIAMVCNLSFGKDAYPQNVIQEALTKAEDMAQESLTLMDKDAESFAEVGKVYAMPKETADDLLARKKAMNIALKGCTLPPMDLMELSVEGLALINTILGKSTPHAVSDLGAAALFFKTALEGAWLNVCINLAYLKDEEFCSTKDKQGEELLETGRLLADNIYHTVEEMVRP